jgi:phosphatidylserine/phosphatidylglycerophosphate/cardiolipin synthase-like enzyme
VNSPLLIAVLRTVERLPAAVVSELAQEVLRASPAGPDRLLGSDVPQQDFRIAAEALAAAWKREPTVGNRELAAMLMAAAAARGAANSDGRVEVVMTGPSEPDAPTRATEAVVTDLVATAQRELLLVTYAAVPYPPLLSALAGACGRGVRSRVVLETVAGSRGLLTSEPAKAFSTVPALQLYHWPLDRRAGPLPGRLHAKVVVADQTQAFVTSANLTGGAMENNLEAGLLVHGGTVPRRLADHFSALMRVGVIQPLPVAGR